QLLFAFRNFPLVQIHPYALSAALAAEAAGAQGKFWQMHDLLYEHQDALAQSDLIGYARDLGPDVDKFSRDLENRTYLPKIESDIRSGEESGIPGTPTFFVNGEMYQGPVTAEGLIDAARAVRR
ncbi:MAG TPA: thioredoxin domain-containing protein, partial [Chloroflexota bacterium]|nr:thioredoxin domain-containing protein [Chloroflexota bacterium]